MSEKPSEKIAVTNQPTKIKVFRSVKLRKGKESEVQNKEDEQIIEVTPFDTHPAMVSAEVPITISKNYQSIGIKIGISMPCYREEIEDAVDEVITRVLERVAQEIPRMNSAIDKLSL